MQLKFIGTDGSMGLKRDNVYDVRIQSGESMIWVDIINLCKCPYESPQSFAANWSKA
jgi:hypothetical protein